MRTNPFPVLGSTPLKLATLPAAEVQTTDQRDSRFDWAIPTGFARNSIDPIRIVAPLSTERILELGRGELIDLIRSVRATHLRPGVLERLPQMDGETLRRLVFLTRRYCRNQQLLIETSKSPNTYVAFCG